MASNSDVPIDPDEYALYMQYGPNWRAASGRSNKRDRGGRYDRFMKFFHTTPFQPMPISTLKFENPYEKPDVVTEPDWYYQLNKTQQQIYDLLSNYFPADTLEPSDFEERDFLSGAMDWSNPNTTASNNIYGVTPPGWTEGNGVNAMVQVNWVNTKTGERLTAPHAGFNPPSGEGWVKEEFMSEPLDPKKLNRPDATIMGNTGTTATQPFIIQPAAQQTTAAYAQMAQNNAATAATPPANNDRSGDRIVAAAPAPVVSRANPPAAAKTTMSDQYITRYDRDESSPIVSAKKPVTTTKKVKAI